ncbi:Mediator complex, subunit Med16 [Elaphomyces granulatus]
MDSGLDVDDLFGDGLGLSSPSPPPKGLAQRLDEMRLLGCCQKIAWSRLGCIAYIAQDGLHLCVRHLVCRPSDGKWTLSDENPLHPLQLAGDPHDSHSLVQLVHLSWNEAGSDLAVVDSSGRISIYAISTAVNSLALQRPAILDPDDDGSQLIHAFRQAAKHNGRWAYTAFRHRPIGPFHPAGKSAVLGVTRSGLLRLLYQNPDHRWADASAELKHAGHSDRLLTHAALVATPGGILIATYSACQKIALYRVYISWNPANWDQNPQKQLPTNHPFPTPTFRLVPNKIETPSSIFPTHRNLAENLDDFPPAPSSPYCLTRLDIIPEQPDSTGGFSAGPWILAVYSVPVHPAGDSSQSHHPSSVIVRWQLETSPQVLHPKFDDVASKRHNIQPKPKIELRRQADIYFERFVISIDHTEYGNVLAITFDDSSISFHDPKTMVSFTGIDDANTVTSMAQAGFHYPLDASAFHISFSPNSGLAVVLDGEWQIRLRSVEHSFGTEERLYDESKFSAAVAALALAFCRGCGRETNTDDLLMVILRQLEADAQNVFIHEIYRGFQIDCNFTVEQEKLIHHMYIPRCLSVQAALGFKDRYSVRTLPSAVSWGILNLRHASMFFMYFLQHGKGSKEAVEPADSDVLRMVLGNAKWILDLSYYVLDDVFDLADEFESVFSDQEAFAQKVKSTNSFSLILLLSSMPRAFLRYICRELRGIHAGYTTSYLPSVEARLFYTELFHLLDSSPVRIDVYEKFLAGVDSAVRHAYQGAGFGDAERPAPEKELLLNNRIPAVLIPAVSTVLRQTVPAVKRDLDRMAIYLADYSWLGFSNDRRTRLYRHRRSVDILEKTPFPLADLQQSGSSRKGGSYATQAQRQCVRCCEITGDVNQRKPVVWLRMLARLGLLRNCLCGGVWAAESGISSLPNEAQGQSSTREGTTDAPVAAA